MRKILDYTIVRQWELYKFREEVNELLRRGYELVGGVSAGPENVLCQALAVYEKQEAISLDLRSAEEILASAKK